MKTFEVMFDISTLTYTIEANDKFEAVQIGRDRAYTELPDSLEIVNILVDGVEY